MNPSVEERFNSASRKRRLDTILETGPSRSNTLRPLSSTPTSSSVPSATSRSPSGQELSLQERFAKSKWAGGSEKLVDISQLSLRYRDGAAPQVTTSRIEYQSIEPAYAEPPPANMLGATISPLDKNHWFTKLAEGWLKPKIEKKKKKKKKKKKVVVTDTSEPQPPPPQSPEVSAPDQTLSVPPKSPTDSSFTLSPTITQCSEMDDAPTLAAPSPMDVDTMGKLMAALDMRTVEGNTTQQNIHLAVREETWHDQAQASTAGTSIAPEAPEINILASGVHTSSPPTQTNIRGPPTRPINVAPVPEDVAVQPSMPLRDLAEFMASLSQLPPPSYPSPNIAMPPSIPSGTAASIPDQSLAFGNNFANLSPPPIVPQIVLTPADDLPQIIPSQATFEGVFSVASMGTQPPPPAPLEAPPKALTSKPKAPANERPVNQTITTAETTAPRPGQRNLKNKGVHRCPVPGCDKVYGRSFDLHTRHIPSAHPDFKGTLDSSEELDCPLCGKQFSRRDALVRHARNITREDRKNKPSCPITWEEYLRLRKKPAKNNVAFVTPLGGG